MKTEIIKFHDDELIAYKEGDQIFVAVRPIINSIGLRPDSALKAIKNDEILGDVYAIRRVHDSTGRVQNMVIMPIQHIHGWLFSIQVNKVKPEIKEKLILYKKECYKALYDHFFGSYRKVADNIRDRAFHHHRILKIDRLISSLKKEKHKEEAIIERIDQSNYFQFELFQEQNQLKR